MKKNVLEFQKLAPKMASGQGNGTQTKPGTGIDAWTSSTVSISFCR